MIFLHNLCLFFALSVWLWLSPFSAMAEDGLEAYRLGQFRRAYTLLRPLAESGDAQAQFTIAMMYSSGRGVPLDEQRAAHWFTLASAQGHRDAEYRLAQLYEQGWGVTPSQEQSIDWYQRCAAQSDPRCQARLKQLNVVEQATDNPAPIISTKTSETVASSSPVVESGTEPPPSSISIPSESPSPPTETANPEATDSEFLGKDWIQAQNPLHYTIQIFTSPDEQDTRNYARRYNLTGNMAIASELRRGKTWYNLIYGSYESSRSANRARANLPPEVTKSNPWPRRFRLLQTSSPVAQ